MRFFLKRRHDHDEPRPCPHMKTLLSALSDGTLGGLARWYTEQHVKGCPGCAAGLKALRGLRDRLRTLASGGAATMVEPQPALPGERRAAVLRAWADAEQRHEEKTRTP